MKQLNIFAILLMVQSETDPVEGGEEMQQKKVISQKKP